jgi:plastocyanin domain-containing protein
MIRAAIVVLALLSACKKADEPKPAAAKPAPPAVAMTTGSDGLRHVAIEANKEGYTPASIPGKPGEKLVLTFTRTADSSCISQLKTPDGKMVDLPMNTPVDVAVTVPQTGKLEFACGMDMFHGEIVAQPGA